MISDQIDFFLNRGIADIAGNIQIVAVIFNFLHRYTAGVALFFFSVLVAVHDFIDMFACQAVLALAFFKIIGGVDKQNVVFFFTFFQHQNADWNTC